ncbi:DMT family transporter [Sandaracinobacteroides sayramensis]|uniref:DMT family transporter n=1 Tax=Sandaracinobacteroides sayramensis TaxID=2913411 RepID=UPI001EDBDC7A|nr:multidrug efflux SMR transporter [Sandaracinobacteroides sayramensis]
MRLRPWLFLAAAIVAEITGVVSMKFAAESATLPSFVFMYAMIGLSFYFLSKAMVFIPVAATYAVWEGVGMTVITIIGYSFLGEGMGTAKILAIAALIAGIVLVNFGIVDGEDQAGHPEQQGAGQ